MCVNTSDARDVVARALSSFSGMARTHDDRVESSECASVRNVPCASIKSQIAGARRVTAAARQVQHPLRSVPVTGVEKKARIAEALFCYTAGSSDPLFVFHMAETVAAPERTLPHNLDAERSVLGAILVHNDAFNSAAQVIDARDFYRDAHRRVFDRMVALNERSQAIDFVTLKEELSRAGELDEVGGPAYIASLADGVPRATNVEYYARIVKEKSTLRQLIYAANGILTNAYEADQESDVVLDEAESAIFAVAEGRLKAGFVPMSELVRESFPKIEQLFEQKRLITGVPSGFADLDTMTRGFQRGDLVIVAARPSMGKTSLVLNVSQYVAMQADSTVGFFSLEMSKESLFLRLLTSEAQIDSHRLLSGAIGHKDYGRLSHALEVLNSMRLFIDDTAGIGVLEMRAKARRLQKEHGLSLLVIDYIQLMSGRGRFENRTLELASISRSLKGLAKELNIPIVVLSQLSRAPESRSDHRPQLSDLRESGALEQDADVVVLIYRDDAYNRDPNSPDAGTAELIVAKQRNGPTGVVRLAFLREQTRFANLAS
jgi:replicative DNA helicase